MAYKVDWSLRAMQDLEEIVKYIAEDNTEAAKKVGYSIIQQVESVSEFPRQVPEFNQPNLREAILLSYRIIFQLEHEKDTLYVVRVWHAARGLPDI